MTKLAVLSASATFILWYVYLFTSGMVHDIVGMPLGLAVGVTFGHVVARYFLDQRAARRRGWWE